MADISNLSDIQSESGVVGTLIYHPEYIAYSDYLKPNHFYGTENGCIYWAIKELFESGITNIDAYNISNKLQSNKAVQRTIEKYNLPAVQDFMELYKETARNSVEEYKMLADNIVSFAFKRELVKSLNQINAEIYNKKSSLETLDNFVYSKLDNITREFVVGHDILTIGEQTDSFWNEIVERRSNGEFYGMPSRYKCFNDYFTYEKGELVIVQAKYKEGKSILLMNEAIHKLYNGIPTLVVDTEMSSRMYFERLLANISCVEIKKIKSGNYTNEEAERIEGAKQIIKTLPLVHIYDPEMTMEKLYSICVALQNKIGLEFLIYDYLKSNETSSSDNYNVLGYKADYLKNNIAGKLDIPVLSACQLNRQGEISDSIKINRYLSVGIKWGHKTQEQIMKDGKECGNYFAKIYVNRLGQQMQNDDDEEYLDFILDGGKMLVEQAKQHERPEDDF